MQTNREIKFRALRSPFDTEFIHGGYFNYSTEEGLLHFIFTSQNGAVQVDPKTISQFTGVKDVNGTDIYEWDLVKRNEGGNYIAKYQVVYTKTFFGLRVIQSHIFKRGAIIQGMDNLEVYTDISYKEEDNSELINLI